MDVYHELAKNLEKNNIKIKYDPENRTFTPWYGLKQKVEVTERGYPYYNPLKQRIRIPKKLKLSGIELSLDEMTDVFLHEAFHSETWFIHGLIALGAGAYAALYVEDPLLKSVTFFGVTLLTKYLSDPLVDKMKDWIYRKISRNESKTK